MRNCCGVCLGEPRRLFQEKTKKVIANVIMRHLQNVSLTDFYDAEVLGVSKLHTKIWRM